MKTLNRIFLVIAAMAVSFTVASCSNDENVIEAQDASQSTTTRAVGTKTPKFTTYIETNDINPLNAGEYYFTGTNPQEQVVDHVILFASNIRGTASSVQLYHNPNQTYILNNVNTLVKPLQDKGIKVLLGLLGDHTGVGFANLTNENIAAGDSLLNDFAYQIADCVTTYGLDGVDFDDEYAEYGQNKWYSYSKYHQFWLTHPKSTRIVAGQIDYSIPLRWLYILRSDYNECY